MTGEIETFNRLLAGFAEDALTDLEIEQFQDILESEPDLKAFAEKHLAVDGLLRANLAHAGIQSLTAQAVMNAIQAEDLSSQTTHEVMSQVSRISGMRVRQNRSARKRDQRRQQAASVWLKPLAAAAILCLVMSLWWVNGSNASGPRVQTVVGSASLGRDNLITTLTAHQQLQADDQLSVAQDASATLVYQDKTRFILKGAKLNLLPGKGKRVRLESGKLNADVMPQSANYPLTIETPHGEILVVGTAFIVSVDQTDSRIEMQHGQVRLKRAGSVGFQLAISDKQVAVMSAGSSPRLVSESDEDGSSVATGLVGHWCFDEKQGRTVKDTSGFNHHGTVQGHPDWVAGRINGAMRFDGRTHAVKILSTPAIHRASKSLTVAAWCYAEGKSPVSPVDAYGSIISRQFGSRNLDQWYLAFKNQRQPMLGIQTDQVSGRSHLQVHDNEPRSGKYLNRWVHLAGTYDGAIARLYLDGELVREMKAEGEILSDPDKALYIGGDVNNNNEIVDARYKGLIDDVRLYDRVLNQSEIRKLFSIGQASKVAATVN